MEFEWEVIYIRQKKKREMRCFRKALSIKEFVVELHLSRNLLKKPPLKQITNLLCSQAAQVTPLMFWAVGTLLQDFVALGDHSRGATDE